MAPGFGYTISNGCSLHHFLPWQRWQRKPPESNSAEDIIDSGLTLSWLVKNLRNRNPRSLEVITLLRKPDALRAKLDIADIGFDIPNEFVIGYGLDYAERYRDLPYVGTLHPRVYQS